MWKINLCHNFYTNPRVKKKFQLYKFFLAVPLFVKVDNNLLQSGISIKYQIMEGQGHQRCFLVGKKDTLKEIVRS